MAPPLKVRQGPPFSPVTLDLLGSKNIRRVLWAFCVFIVVSIYTSSCWSLLLLLLLLMMFVQRDLSILTVKKCDSSLVTKLTRYNRLITKFDLFTIDSLQI